LAAASAPFIDCTFKNGYLSVVPNKLILWGRLKAMILSILGPPGGDAMKMLAWLIAIMVTLWVLTVASKWLAEKIWKGRARMLNTLGDYQTLVAQALPRLLRISDAESDVHPSPEKWSKKEILGHLIDSASNNHQRFVRAQLSSEIKLPEYEQETWVRTQGYQGESWENLVQLWRLYNLHLLHVAEAIPEDRLKSRCFIGENEPVTLEFLVTDYVRHMKHHLDQIFS
jgi:hypothetical protein